MSHKTHENAAREAQERYVERVRSETGGEKDKKLPELGAVDAKALLELAKVAGHGARKYSRHNFLKGYPHSLSVDALYRHLLADQGGEDLDPESGLPHLAHAAWHALAILGQRLHGVGTDDRFGIAKKEPENGLPYVPSDIAQLYASRGEPVPEELKGRAVTRVMCQAESHIFNAQCELPRYHELPHRHGKLTWNIEQGVTP